MIPRSVLHFLLVFTLLFSFAAVSAEEKKETVPSLPAQSAPKDGERNILAGQNKDAVKAVPAEDLVKPFVDDSGKEKKTEDETPLETVNPELFDKGYRAFSRNNVEKAASLLYEYVSKNTFTADDYDWAEFFLGVSLKKSGFTHAAADTLSRVITRKPDVQIVNYALEIFEEITRTMPYDRDLVVLRSICDQEFGFVDDRLNDFIHYHQGVFDWENGLDDWEIGRASCRERV